MTKKKPSSGTPALVALDKAGVAFKVHSFEPDSHEDGGYGLAAARALGLPPERVFKTLMIDVGGKLVCGIVPVSGSLDLKALAGAVGAKKAVMATPADAERATGYVVGGISPLGQKRRHPTVIDASAQGLETMLVSAGARAMDVELAPADLARLTAATYAPIARP